MANPPYPSGPGAKAKIQKTMHEFKSHSLRGGAGNHPKVTDRKQAVAIALSQARRAQAEHRMK